MKKIPKTKIMNKFLLNSTFLLILLMVFTGTPNWVEAQQVTPMVICSGGETFSGSTLSLDFTIGEITTE